MKRYRPLLLRAAFVALLLLGWWGLTAGGTVSALLLPAPASAFGALGRLLVKPDTYLHLRTTLVEFVGALGLATAIGVAAGVAIGLSPRVFTVAEPLLGALNTVPIILIYPLCILYLGIGPGSKIAFATVYGTFPVLLNTIQGIRHVDHDYIAPAVAMGASPWQLLTKVYVPAALPGLVAGLRLAGVQCLVAVVAGEMLAATSGLGYKVSWAAEVFETPILYAFILLVVALVALLNWLLGRIRVPE